MSIQEQFKQTIEAFLAEPATSRHDYYAKLGMNKQLIQSACRAKHGVRLDTAESLLLAAGYKLIIVKDESNATSTSSE